MQQEYDWEVYEIFTEQLESQIPVIEQNIFLLNEKASTQEALNELFRKFHTYKSSSAYLHLTPLNKLVSNTEIVLSALREKKGVVQESVQEWLIEVKEQLLIYLEEMQDQKTTLSPLPSYILTKLQITPEYMDLGAKLKTLSLLYMDKNTKRADKLLPFFKKYLKSAQHSTEEDAANSVYNLAPFNILIINLSKENFQVIDFVQSNYPHLPVIAVCDKMSSVTLSKLEKRGITHSLTNPLNAKSLYSELLSITKAYHSSSNILIEHKKINKFIQTLQPLSNTILQVLQVCDDKDSSIKDLIKTVKSDPILSLNILKVANSPIYGSIELKTIDQAVGKFGKQMIKALTLSDLSNSLGAVELSAYNINEKTFSKVSMLRLSLMIKWYAKVSIADLSTLSSCAVLGNLGQLLIAKELLELDLDEQFKELCVVFDIKYAEESLLNTTTSYVSSQILKYLKLPQDIVEIVEHSDNHLGASQELQKLALANHIVSSLIDLRGNIADEIPQRVLSLMEKSDLKPEPLNKALLSIKEVNR